MAGLRLEAVSKRFGAMHAVDEVSLDIADGEFLVLLGPSGCGKSTLLRMIAGLEEPSSGRILLDGNDITDTPAQRRDLAMVFQSYALYPHLTVAKNIAFPLRARRRRRARIREQVAAVAATLQLEELLGRRPAALSGGQRQRVALARAMVRDPGAFLMDEPLSNLDAKLRSATRAELIALHRRLGATFLYVTHDQVEAMTMATRIALLDAGRVEQVGTPEELYDRPRSVFVAGFLGSPPMNLFPALVRERDGELRVTAGGIDTALGVFAPAADSPDSGAAAADHPTQNTGAQNAAADATEQKVVAGIRPENLRLEPGATDISGTVTMVENLGSEELVHFSTGELSLCARVTRPAGVSVGERIGARVAPDRIHLFDPESGLRLRWREPQSTIPTAHDDRPVVPVP